MASTLSWSHVLQSEATLFRPGMAGTVATVAPAEHPLGAGPQCHRAHGWHPRDRQSSVGGREPLGGRWGPVMGTGQPWQSWALDPAHHFQKRSAALLCRWGPPRSWAQYAWGEDGTPGFPWAMLRQAVGGGLPWDLSPPTHMHKPTHGCSRTPGSRPSFSASGTTCLGLGVLPSRYGSLNTTRM